MGFDYTTGYEKISLETFSNPKLLEPACKITNDIASYVLPLFLDAVDLCSLAYSNQEWAKVLKKHFEVLEEWKKHAFLQKDIETPQKYGHLFKVVSIFLDTIGNAKPLANKFDYPITQVSFHTFPNCISDLNLVSFCEEMQGPNRPVREVNESLCSYAEKLEFWIKSERAFKQVRSLDLKNKKLTALPESIENLTALRSLYLDNNKLTHLPNCLKNLTALTSLYLENNHLTSLPDSIVNLTGLVSLHLGDNHLTSLPESIGNLTALIGLYLDNNELSSLPDAIANLKELICLNVENNLLRSIPDSIGKLRNLGVLEMTKNNLRSLPSSIGNLASLWCLDVSDNGLRSLPDSIGQCTQLTWLHLEKNPFLSLPPSLSKLKLKNPQVTMETQNQCDTSKKRKNHPNQV